MTILNTVGATGFTRNFHEPLEGQIGADTKCRPMRNPVLQQITTVTIAGFGADADSFTIYITLPNGVRVTACTITRASAVPVDDTAAAAAAVTAINALAALNGHVTATSALGVITLTFDHPNIAYTVETAVTACTATVATSQTAGGSAIPYGRFIAHGTVGGNGQAVMRALTSTDRDAQVRGVTARPQVGVNLGSATGYDGVVQGDMGDVVYDDIVAMKNTSSTAAVAGGQVWAVVATTGGDEIGEARPDGSGTTQVATITVVADHQDYQVEAVLLVNGERRRISFSYNPTDGTTATDDVVDGLEDAAAAAITALSLGSYVSASTASAAASFTLTAAAGYEFESVYVSSWGEDTEAAGGSVVLAASGLYAIPLDPKRYSWFGATPAGTVGYVMVRS